MTDLTLDEYRGVPEDELKKILRKQAMNMGATKTVPSDLEMTVKKASTWKKLFS